MLQSLLGDLDRRTTRQRILSVATELFSQKGYSACLVAEIVERAGVTKPVLYYYFGSKEGLFRAILEEAGKLQERMLREALEGEGPALDRIRTLFRKIYEEVMGRPHLFRLLHQLAFSRLELAVVGFDMQRFHGRMIEAISKLVEQAVTEGQLACSDPQDAALVLLAVLSLCIDMDQCYPQTADPERLPRLLNLALAGLGAR